MEELISNLLVERSQELFGAPIEKNLVQFQQTRKEFAGDITLVTFPFTKIARKKPEEIGEEIGAFLKQNLDLVADYNVVKGFLNISIDANFWLNRLNEIQSQANFGFAPENSQSLKMVEFASPNTNKPLHLGHLRNIFLGDSVARILKAAGHKVIRTQIINDRGIHICKSMLAWQRYGNGETPQSSGMKGDKLAGKYYVEFDKQLNTQASEIIAKWEANDFSATSDEVKQEVQKLLLAIQKKADDEKAIKEIQSKIKELAKNHTEILLAAKEMLVKWEAKDPEVYALWELMNGWVYEGFDETFETMHVGFDKLYYESDTYILGKSVVEEGLQKEVFYQKEDGSVWCDLTNDGLDEKLLLRSDGTSVYMTQDIGTAIERYKDFPDMDGVIYTVGNEQNYHFKVLFLILQKLGYSWADKCFHLSYGMVDLPTGKMKSREGTVVDADDLMADMIQEAKSLTNERGSLDEMSEDEITILNDTIGLGALKYYLLKVDPKKRMLFNPAESIELNGNTAPFIQYGYARIQSLMRKAEGQGIALNQALQVGEQEVELIKMLQRFQEVIAEAATTYSPALIANYCFELTKAFNGYYQANNFLKEENENLKKSQLILCDNIGKVLQSGMNLMGIEVPNRM